jgi:hypothetical protein
MQHIVTYYFSTHGCNLLSCTGADCFEELADAAAAACRALISKKLAMLALLGGNPQYATMLVFEVELVVRRTRRAPAV